MIPGLDELKLNLISKVLFNAKQGVWYNSKQQVVWDTDYFTRHAKAHRAQAAPLEIPQNLLGIDTIPVIFGIGVKVIGGSGIHNRTSSLQQKKQRES